MMLMLSRVSLHKRVAGPCASSVEQCPDGTLRAWGRWSAGGEAVGLGTCIHCLIFHQQGTSRVSIKPVDGRSEQIGLMWLRGNSVLAVSPSPGRLELPVLL